MYKNMPEKWDGESDVIVVGYGGAGAAAAITACDCGAQVTILEKMPAGGGNTRVSGGGFLTPTDMEFAKYVESLCFGATEIEIIEHVSSRSFRVSAPMFLLRNWVWILDFCLNRVKIFFLRMKK